MARITVEDCLKRIDNQFELVLIAAKRARRLANGADALVELENDKPTVVALREIAEGLINEEILAEMSEPEEDILSSEEAEELLASTPMPGMETSRVATPASPSAPAAAFASAAAAPIEKAAPPAAVMSETDALAEQIAAEFASALAAPDSDAAPAADSDSSDAEPKPEG